jgi:hypothetical protein
VITALHWTLFQKRKLIIVASLEALCFCEGWVLVLTKQHYVLGIEIIDNGRDAVVHCGE